jgi:hypothetical protein
MNPKTNETGSLSISHTDISPSAWRSENTATTSIKFFIKHFTKMKNKHKENPYINAQVLTAWFKFDNYYKKTDKTPIYTVLVLLHPKL